MVKTCSGCNTPKPLNEFEFRNDRKTYRTKCRFCTNERTRKANSKNPLRTRLRQYTYKAREHGIEFMLSEDDLTNLFKSSCHYCGTPPPTNLHGIDRVNPKLGYLKENCVSCCWRCNRAKNNDTYEVFIEWATSVYKHQSVENAQGIAHSLHS